MKKRDLFFCLLFIFSVCNVSADVISVNAGGSEEIVVNPDTYIDGFFSCVPTTCAKLGYACGDWYDGCYKTIDCGSCSSGYTCSGGICTAETPEGGGPGGGGGGGGSGSGNGTVTPVASLVVSPSSINLTLSFNNETHMSQRVTQQIYVTNNGAINLTLPISQSGLDNIIMITNTSISVNPGQTAVFPIDFVAPFQQKDFSGYIQVGTIQVPIFLHVTSNPLWFDSNIVVLNKDYKISQGNLLKTRVELVPMGEKSRLDVTLNYVIKDISGKVFLTKSETVLVENRVNFDRNFDTGMLPLGKYVIYLDLIYPGGVAPSSAHFDIIQKSAGDFFGIILFILVIGIIIIAILLVLLLIRKKKRKGQEQGETTE